MIKNKISINLDITPSYIWAPIEIISREQYARHKVRQKKHINVAFPFIKCYNLTASLCFGMFISNGSMVTKCIDETAIGLDDETLITAIESQGGAINRSDKYAISQSIRSTLSAHIDIVKELVEEAFSD